MHRTPFHIAFRTVSRGLAAAGLMLACAAAVAATPINETRPLDPRGSVQVENIKGRIQVRAWDRPEVKIEGSLGAGVEKLEIEGDRGELSIRVRYPQRSGWNWGSDRSEPTELRLMVPLLADLSVEAVSADVDVQGVASRRLSIDAVSGDVVVVGAPRSAEIDTVSGNQQLTLNSADVAAETVSGDLALRGRLDGEVSVESVSGQIDVAVREARVAKLTAASVSGDVRLAAALAKGAELSVETVSGDVRVRLPRDLSASVRGESFSGDLAAPGASIDRPRHGPGASFRHRYGGGDADVSLQTFSGDATLELE